MQHSTYKHLEDRIKLSGLTLGQWALLFVGAITAYGVSKLVPLPGVWPLSLAITVVGIPLSLALAASLSDFSVWALLLAIWRYRRHAQTFLPGIAPDANCPGYVVALPEEAPTDRTSGRRMERNARLWDLD